MLFELTKGYQYSIKVDGNWIKLWYFDSAKTTVSEFKFTIPLQGRQWVILRGGRMYIYNRTDEIIHGLSPSVNRVAPTIRDMSLAKAGGGTRPQRPPHSVAPLFG